MTTIDQHSSVLMTTSRRGAVVNIVSGSPVVVPFDVVKTTANIRNPRLYRSGANSKKHLPIGLISVDYLVFEKRSVKIGTRNETRRRYRWRKGRNGSFKEFYIEVVKKPIYQVVQVPRLKKKLIRLPSQPRPGESRMYTNWIEPNDFIYRRWDNSYSGGSTSVLLTANTGEQISVTSSSQWIEPLQWDSTLVLPTRFVKSSILQAFPVISEQNLPGVPFGKFTWTGFPDIKGQLEREALFKCYTKIADDYPNVAMMISELPQSVKMVTQILNKGMKLIKSLKKAQLRKSKDSEESLRKSMSDAWLMWVYGVNPMIGDIAKTYALEAASYKFIRTYTASSFYDAYKGSEIRPKLSSAHRFEHFVDRSFFARQGVTLAVEQQMSMQAFKQMADLLGFSSGAAVAYEMLPFSFVVDWAVPIGDFLNSKDILRHFTQKANWNTFGVRESIFTKAWVDSASVRAIVRTSPSYVGLQHASVSSTPFYINYKAVNMEREASLGVLPAMPDPFVMANGVGLSTHRQLSALALFTQRTK